MDYSVTDSIGISDLGMKGPGASQRQFKVEKAKTGKAMETSQEPLLLGSIGEK